MLARTFGIGTQLTTIRRLSTFLVISGPALDHEVGQLNEVVGKTLWKVKEDQGTLLNCELKFKTFASTWKFLNLILLPINELRHHPTITTTYNRVSFDITTHDAGNKVTQMDLALANAINKEYLRFVQGGRTAQKVPDKEPKTLAEASAIINELIERKREERK